MDDADIDQPTLSDQALYLITELAVLLQRTDLATWPDHQARVFHRRLNEINSLVRSQASPV